MENSVQLFKKFGIVGTNYNYSEIANAFLSMGYTSGAGNTYFNSVRLAEGIVIKEDVGQGYCRTFLNGIKIYSIKDKTLLAERNFNCCFYSRSTVRNSASSMLLSTLRDAAKNMNYSFNENQAKRQIDLLLDKAFSEDQRTVLQNQVKGYLA